MLNTPSGGRTKLSLSAQSNLSRSTERKSRLIHSSSSKDSSLMYRHKMSYVGFLFREAHKPDLADAIWVLIGPDVRAAIPNKTVGMYWTGEGALMQRIPLSRGSTYICIVKQ